MELSYSLVWSLSHKKESGDCITSSIKKRLNDECLFMLLQDLVVIDHHVEYKQWSIEAYGSKYQKESVEYASIVSQVEEQKWVFNVCSGEEVDAVDKHENGSWSPT